MLNLNEGDLGLFNDRTHGEIISEGGEPKMEQGLGTCVFISLFSGETGNFWGDELISSESEKYGGTFEKLAESLGVTVENVLLMQEAILSDLQWLKDEEIAVKIEVTSSIQNVVNVLFDLVITRPDEEARTFRFSNNWTGQFLNPSYIGIE